MQNTGFFNCKLMISTCHMYRYALSSLRKCIFQNLFFPLFIISKYENPTLENEQVVSTLSTTFALCSCNNYIIFLQIDVVLRCDLGPTHRELFVREAKIMSGLDHEYIMKFYGAVILGPYAHSVGLVSNQYFMSVCFALLFHF